ncbi:hypothetical protein NK8_63470 (plasmid) [Caballeronia sp. NK8]|uniref:hypothetical protein n=1 Tax=Caballeronia sp. NK8 TaxID=140098 RepID=UPI001BB53496|nr:hypothetical protein [Caballeronia sp. NK8]BCQ28158.1 hypothetical protein NK8_63470 [Caballeronia sp. NK8]
MLLPLPVDAARTMALANHLSFVACRDGAGTAYLLNELIRLVYITFYVQDAGFGDTDVIVYARAEAALERSVQRAESERVWRLDPGDLPLFETVLREADRQLASAPRHAHFGAQQRLDRFALSERASPLPAAVRDRATADLETGIRRNKATTTPADAVPPPPEN